MFPRELPLFIEHLLVVVAGGRQLSTGILVCDLPVVSTAPYTLVQRGARGRTLVSQVGQPDLRHRAEKSSRQRKAYGFDVACRLVSDTVSPQPGFRSPRIILDMQTTSQEGLVHSTRQAGPHPVKACQIQLLHARDCICVSATGSYKRTMHT